MKLIILSLIIIAAIVAYLLFKTIAFLGNISYSKFKRLPIKKHY